MKVMFHQVSEFVEELEQDAHLVENKILRVACLYEQEKAMPLVRLVVVATCIIRGKVVTLRQGCGQMLTPHPGVAQRPAPVEALAHRLQETLRQEGARLGLSLRAGIYEEG
jgi:hypothetical protein